MRAKERDVTHKNFFDNFKVNAIVSTKTQGNAMQNNVNDKLKNFFMTKLSELMDKCMGGGLNTNTLKT